MSRNDEPKILLDSDVIRHFISGGKILHLTSIYPSRFVILDKVRDEICRSKSLEQTVNNFLSMNKVPIISFPIERNIIKEYSTLVKTLGEGESACLAVAKFQKQYIASSNLRDIKAYCETHGIIYLTTMDILKRALEIGKFTEQECDEFIYDVKRKGSKLPCNTIAEYIQKYSKSSDKGRSI